MNLSRLAVLFQDDLKKEKLKSTEVFKMMVSAEVPMQAEQKHEPTYSFIPHARCIGSERGKTHTEYVQRIRNILEEMMEDYMLNGKINPVSGIFLMKNNFDYQDKAEVVLTPNTPLGEEVPPEVLCQKYLDDVGAYEDEE